MVGKPTSHGTDVVWLKFAIINQIAGPAKPQSNRFTCTQKSVSVERFAKLTVLLPMRIACNLRTASRLRALNPAFRAHVES